MSSHLEKMHSQFNNLNEMYKTTKKPGENAIMYLMRMVGFNGNYEVIELLKSRVQKLEGEQELKDDIIRKLVAIEVVIKNYQGDASDLGMGFQFDYEDNPQGLVGYVVNKSSQGSTAKRQVGSTYLEDIGYKDEVLTVKKKEHKVGLGTALSGFKDYPQGISDDCLFIKDGEVVDMTIKDKYTDITNHQIVFMRSNEHVMNTILHLTEEQKTAPTVEGKVFLELMSYILTETEMEIVEDINVVNLGYASVNKLRGKYNIVIADKDDSRGMKGIKKLSADVREIVLINKELEVYATLCKGLVKDFMTKEPVDVWVLFQA